MPKQTDGNHAAVIAVDPGPIQSALVTWNGSDVLSRLLLSNTEVLIHLHARQVPSVLVIEQVASYGMPVGAHVFETVYWSGRFAQLWSMKDGNFDVDRMPRKDVKMHLCHSMKAKDSNVRQALIERFGPPGTKKQPGLTYGLSGDTWAAFALAVTWWDKNHLCVGERE